MKVSFVEAQREGGEAGLGEGDPGLGLGVLTWRLLQNINIEMSKGWLKTRTGSQRQVKRTAHSRLK